MSVIEQAAPGLKAPAHNENGLGHGKDQLPDDAQASKENHKTGGVRRMEAVYRETGSSRKSFWVVAISVLVCAWAYSLDSSTTSYYSVDASSYFEEHSSLLATLSIATKIISAVSKPFIAKISDITSRPYTYLVALLFYIVGYIVVATGSRVSGYVVGEVFVAVGSSGLDLINDIIVADLTTLEWRGFASSMLSTPFIINTWFAGKIVGALDGPEDWRWGYGMFAIIMPVALGPAIVTLIFLDRKARKHGITTMASSNYDRRAAIELAGKSGDGAHGAAVTVATGTTRTWREAFKNTLQEMDAFGLILLGFGWSLLLLPFSLKTYADNGWQNQSLIAMMVVGGLVLVAYVVYEWKWARVPSAPRRLIANKTFVMAIIIDFFYMRMYIPGTLFDLEDLADPGFQLLVISVACIGPRTCILQSHGVIKIGSITATL